MRVSAEVKGAEQLAGLSKRLKAAGKDGKLLRRELLKGIRRPARPMLADVKRAVQSIPVTGSRGGGRRAREEIAFERSRAKEETRRAKARRGSGLRQTIAAATRLIVKAGSRVPLVRIEVDGKRLPEDQQTLPRHLDSPSGWRHPLFGNRDRWYQQRGQPWFKSTLRRHAPKVRKEVIAAMKRVAKKIED